MTSQPVIDVLHGIRKAYRLATVAAIIGGPFGSSIGYAMQSLRGPAFTAYPNMLGHRRSIASFDNPDGDGLWLEVIGEAQDLFSERQQWESWHLHRMLRLSCRVWWGCFFSIVLSTLCLLGAENWSIGIPLAWSACAMIALSVLGALFSDRFTEAVYRSNVAFLDRISAELPDRLWSVIDAIRAESRKSASLETAA